jgi:predicted metal-binding membrane protein
MSLVASHAGSGVGGAWKLGLHHGLFCTLCCWGLMVIQLVLGIMSLAAMIAVGLVITLEKLLPFGPWVARAAGAAAVVGGVWILLL